MPPPVRYAGGVIYTSVKMKAFRVLTTAGDNYSEVPVRWKGSLPTQASWKKAVDAIGEARKTTQIWHDKVKLILA